MYTDKEIIEAIVEDIKNGSVNICEIIFDLIDSEVDYD